MGRAFGRSERKDGDAFELPFPVTDKAVTGTYTAGALPRHSLGCNGLVIRFRAEPLASSAGLQGADRWCSDDAGRRCFAGAFRSVWGCTPGHISLHGGLAILYLIVFGSLISFTAFIWLLGRMPATRVASHAYVNPVVAVALGYFVAGEMITPRMLLGAAIVLVSVFLILRKDATGAPT